MVVLFVFATIQEQRLDDSARSEQRLEQRLREAQTTLQQVRAQQDQQAHERAVAERERAAAQAQIEGEAEHLRRELSKMQQAFAEHREQTRQELEAIGAPDTALEHLEVLSRLLERHSVFEIEIQGRFEEDGSLRSRCCFRVDPLKDRWQSCGSVPHRADDRALWLDEGAGGLTAALRRTKGGNAMTLVRQDSVAKHRIAGDLVDLLRERFSDHSFHAEQKAVLEERCSK